MKRTRSMSRKAAAILAVLLAVVIGVGATFAWNTSRATLVNSLTNKGYIASEGVVVVEDFNPLDPIKPNTEITKEVKVTNASSADVLVRLTFEEMFNCLGNKGEIYWQPPATLGVVPTTTTASHTVIRAEVDGGLTYYGSSTNTSSATANGWTDITLTTAAPSVPAGGGAKDYKLTLGTLNAAFSGAMATALNGQGVHFYANGTTINAVYVFGPAGKVIGDPEIRYQTMKIMATCVPTQIGATSSVYYDFQINETDPDKIDYGFVAWVPMSGTTAATNSTAAILETGYTSTDKGIGWGFRSWNMQNNIEYDKWGTLCTYWDQTDASPGVKTITYAGGSSNLYPYTASAANSPSFPLYADIGFSQLRLESGAGYTSRDIELNYTNKTGTIYNHVTNTVPTGPIAPNTAKWYYNAADGYFYYLELLQSGSDTDTLLQGIRFSGTMTAELGKADYKLGIVLEALQAVKAAISDSDGGGWSMTTTAGTLGEWLQGLCAN